MFDVLRFPATATLTDVVRGIQRTPAHRIALVFPLGIRVSVAEVGRMGVVDLLCQEQRKEATIVGGDAQLRACAVACGLPAAMTVADWRAMRPQRTDVLARRPKARPPATVRLTLLPPLATDVASLSGENADFTDDTVDPVDELPSYIRELLALHGHELPATSARHLYAAPRHPTIATTLDHDDDLRERWECDEQLLTETIRRSSGLSSRLLAAKWRSTQMAPSDGATQ